MATVDSTSFAAALKEYYSDEGVRDTTYDENPWLAMVPKLETFSGKYYVQPIQYSIPSGRSADFTKAQANRGTNKYEDFQVTVAEDYGVISITRKVMKESASNRGAFFEARTREIDGMLKKLTRSAAIALYRDGSGSIGSINSSYTSGTSFTLSETEDITNFEVGDVLQAATSTTATPRAGTMTVTDIDRDAGTITVNAAISGLAASDELFVEGDQGSKIMGLLGWIPGSAPSATPFFGVDRTADVTRLAGSRVTATTVSIQEAIRMGSTRLGREGAAPDCAFMTFAKYQDLELQLENKVVYDTTNVTANVGFTGIKIVGSRRPITCYADQNAYDNAIFLLTKDTWKLFSMGPIPDMVDDDGVTMLREVAAAGYEVRADYFGNLVCEDPRANCIVVVES